MTRFSIGNVCLASAVLAVCWTGIPSRAADLVDTAVAAGSFKTLATALQAADLVGALKGEGPFTVFAPTDEAFAKLPPGTVEMLLKPENKAQLVSVLTYHVVKGKVPAAKVVELTGAKTLNGQQIDIKVEDGKVFVDKANVTKTDIACSNGVIHVIDHVLLPATDDIPATAEKAGSFKTLLAALDAAGLSEALAGKGPFTVFAPTDDAFAKLPAGTVETLLLPENRAKLAAILKYHVVEGRVYASDALAAGKAKTLQGGQLTIVAKGKAAKVNEANLVLTDLDAANGVIHVIDSVLLPPEKQAGVDPRQVIESAISQGAPLYNSGHQAECAKIYMATARHLLGSGHYAAGGSTSHTLQTALMTSEQSTCSATQAWTMRQALEVAYRDLR